MKTLIIKENNNTITINEYNPYSFIRNRDTINIYIEQLYNNEYEEEQDLLRLTLTYLIYKYKGKDISLPTTIKILLSLSENKETNISNTPIRKEIFNSKNKELIYLLNKVNINGNTNNTIINVLQKITEDGIKDTEYTIEEIIKADTVIYNIKNNDTINKANMLTSLLTYGKPNNILSDNKNLQDFINYINK